MEIEVIKKKEGKLDKNTGKLLSDHLRVAAYARVSTDSEEQATSFTYNKNTIWIRFILILAGATWKFTQTKEYLELKHLKEKTL